MDLFGTVLRMLHDRKQAWKLTTLIPLAVLLVDILMLSVSYSSSGGSSIDGEKVVLSNLLVIFGVFASVSLVPALLSYWILGEVGGYGGMTFLRAWRIIAMIFPGALMFFGLFFILNFSFISVILGLVSIGVGIAGFNFIKLAYKLRLTEAKAKQKKVAELIKKRKKKPGIDKDKLRQHEEDMVEWALEQLDKKKRRV